MDMDVYDCGKKEMRKIWIDGNCCDGKLCYRFICSEPETGSIEVEGK